MSDYENEDREENLDEPETDTAHPFDQTNGMAEGLEGDADSPEEADRRTQDGDGVGLLAAPSPGTQMPAGVIPVGPDGRPDVDADADGDADPDADDPSPA